MRTKLRTRHSEFTDIHSVDDLFPVPPNYPYSDGMVTVETIPYAARTAVEFLHDERPDAVIAADRGGRMMGFATHYAWSKRYPDERFPTRKNSIQFARLTRKELDRYEYRDLLVRTLGRAGVIGENGSLIANKDSCIDDIKITLMDDWVFRGRSLGLFRETAWDLGITDSNISVITMCNKPAEGVKHAVNPAFTVWEMSAWKDNSDAVGVHYPDHPARPVVLGSDYAREQRRDIIESVDRYFEKFDAHSSATLAAEQPMPERLKRK